MKTKIILLLSLCAVFSASAATIKWGTSGYAYYGEKKLTSGAATGYLVYLGNEASWSNFSFEKDFSKAELASKGTTTLGAVGANNTFSVTVGKAIGGTAGITDLLIDGTSAFGILLTTEQEGKTYYYLGNTFVFDTTSSSYTAGTSMFTETSTVSPSSTTKWTAAAVPEPATGALALAGIALLFKRRKARA